MAGNRQSDRLVQPPRPKRDRFLEEAIAADSITILFQPQVEPATGRITAVEALARWIEEPDSERLFGRANAAGLGERLSRHVQRKSIAIAAGWRGPLESLRLSLNVAAEDIGRDGFDGWLTRELSDKGFDPHRLTVEITESSIVADADVAALRLAALRAIGVRIALDDFGSGFANMSYLSRLPLDALKIDRALTAGLNTRRGRIVVRSLIAMARELGLSSVVEGVETQAQHALVRDWGCDLVQGFLAAEPLDEAELARFVSAGRRAAA